jgi:hypothetical protein
VSGPRFPSFSGGDPGARGWRKVGDLLWVDADASPLGAGDGGEPVPPPPLAPGTPAESGYRLRSDHVTLRTNVAWEEAVRIARVAEAHVAALFRAYGEDLDLRLPDAPLAVLAVARRSEFDARLRRLVTEPVSWGAFYVSDSATVYVSHEPAPRGPLPLEADLRHEMTHQVLDLSTPNVGRARIFSGLYFWLWEGIAIHAEAFGDPPGRPANRERFDRFARRLASGSVTPLERFFRLAQAEFEGHHYDQAASLMRFLMEGGVPQGRAAVVETLRDVLRGRGRPDDFERRLGMGAAELEARWLAWARR